ncbi:MAG: hypothetical protein KDB02_08760 [Acidimicrobiales bacterium]|nr:hypothetical protein [Acidimicrobiales bacterium]
MSAEIENLLALQERDTALDQIRHQIEVLPVRVERDGLQAQLAELDTKTEAKRAERDELARRQRRLDDEVESLDAKRKDHDAKLYGGSITNARELQDLQEEIESLGRRITSLEDDELEIMEAVEPIEAELQELASARRALDASLEDVSARLSAAEAELLTGLSEQQEARDVAAASVPADLLAEYEKLRAGGGGIGIARLIGGNQCGGCHLTLSAVEVAAIRKHPDELTHCEECGRLLAP